MSPRMEENRERGRTKGWRGRDGSRGLGGRNKKRWRWVMGVCFYRLAFNKTLQHDVIVREQLHLYVQYHSVNMDHSTAVAVPRTALTCLTFQHPCFLSSLSSPPLLFSAFSDLNRFLASWLSHKIRHLHKKVERRWNIYRDTEPLNQLFICDHCEARKTVSLWCWLTEWFRLDKTQVWKLRL